LYPADSSRSSRRPTIEVSPRREAIMSMHRIPDLRSLAMIPVLVFTILGGPAPALADDRTPVACGRTWTPVAIPHFGQDNLEDIASTSASDVWAVGETGARTTLIEHWDGSGWSRVPSPTPGSWADLTSVTAFTPTDA